jgi:IS5 family transposase
MKQRSLASTGFELATKRTRKRDFLDEMNLVVPWSELVGLIQLHAPAGKTGRPPFAVENMLRIHFMQQWFGLSDPAVEEALHDVPLYYQFAQLDPGMSRLPNESTILRFRHLLEEHELSPKIMAAINATLEAKGLLLKTGTVVDATLIAAPSSTKNKDGECDPEMHQAKKGNQWHIGMKAHIGVDADSGLVHSVIGTAANVNDVTHGHGLLHGQESVVFADAGYQGADKHPAATGVQWQVAMRPGKRRALTEDGWGALLKKAEKLKASVRAKVEHPFRVIKRQFGHVKVRYRGLAKNTAQLVTLFALSNLWMARKRILQGLQASVRLQRGQEPENGPQRV